MMKYASQPNRKIWYVAPTFKMAKEIVWGTLKEMLIYLIGLKTSTKLQ